MVVLCFLHFAASAPENMGANSLQRCIDRNDPLFLDFGDQPNLAGLQALFRFRDEVQANPGDPEVADCSGREAGYGPDCHTRRTAKQTDQAADRQPGGAADGGLIHGLPDADHTLIILDHHAGGIERDVAFRVQLAQGLQSCVCGHFVVENRNQHLVHLRLLEFRWNNARERARGVTSLPSRSTCACGLWPR